jgi:hypothetical protein
MTDQHATVRDAYEQLYSAAARMLWSQEHPTWRREKQHPRFGWSAERCAAWQALEDCLLAGSPEESHVAGEPSDPARHLITRRAPGTADRPLSFEEARQDWMARLNADPIFEGDGVLEPGTCVMTTSSLHWRTVFGLKELACRLAPGRPPVSMGPEAARLGALAHQAADAYRAPLGLPAPSSYVPGTEPWIASSSRPVSDLPDLTARLESLRTAAWRAAEAVPNPDELTANDDFSMRIEACVAASDVLALIRGQSAPVWRDAHEGVDPARHMTWGTATVEGEQLPEPLDDEAAFWAEAVSAGPAPWAPTKPQPATEGHLASKEVLLSATRATVFAEMLDELSARLRPGLHVGRIHYTSYDLVHFIDHGFRRELGLHIGL